MAVSSKNGQRWRSELERVWRWCINLITYITELRKPVDKELWAKKGTLVLNVY
jgi:hypothetical protein